MPTGVAGRQARELATQQTNYHRAKRLGSAGNGTVSLGIAPAGANIVNIYSVVRTVFSGGVPTVSFGTAASPAAFFAAAGAPITTLGRNVVTLIATAALSLTADAELVAVIGGGPNAGDADFMVEFIPNNDK